MPPLVLRIRPDPVALLHEAADGPNRFRMDGTLLTVRQGGIRDDLYRMAGEAGHPGWFDPPACTFHELPDRLGGVAGTPLGDEERAVLLEQLLRTHGGAVFGGLPRPADFVDPVDTLFGELVAEEVSPDTFDRAVACTRLFEEWDVDRFRALGSVYRAWHSVLAALPDRRDGRDTLTRLSQAIAADPEGRAARLNGRLELRILGLTDLRGGWRALLAALRAWSALERLTIYALDDHLLSEGLEADVVERGAAPGPTRAVTILHAPDTDREIEEIAVRVRRLIDRGVAPHRIALVSRKARPHTDLALAALERVGVPATARRRIGYREIPVVKSLVFLLRAAAEGWTRHGLSELARQPYFANRLDVRLIDFLGYRRAIAGLDEWSRALDALVAEARERERGEESEDERRGWLPPSDRAERAQGAFGEFAAVAGELSRPKPLAEWLGWLERFLTDDPWSIERRIRRIPDGRWDVARVDLTGWKALLGTVRAWRKALDQWPGDPAPLDAARFLARLGTLLAGDAVLWTTCRRGVQVLEGLNTAYRGFEHLFVAGLEAGSFPVRRPRSPVLHEEDRRALRDAGLPLDLEAVWEARERSLFAALELAAPHLTLSHATLDAAGREVVGSIFLDEARARGAVEETIGSSRVFTPDLPLVVGPEEVGQALAAARMEADRATGRASPWNGLIEDPGVLAMVAERYGEHYLWSPTQLESYAKCPWSWFSGRVLRLEKPEDPDQEIDPAVRGTIWHAALERFWARVTERLDAEGRQGEDRILVPGDMVWADGILSAALDEAWAAAESGWLGHPALHRVTREALRATLHRYLTWELELHSDWLNASRGHAPETLRTAVLAHEVKIPKVVLERNGVRFAYRGTIDRVEIGVDSDVEDAGRFLAAIDYKSSKWSTPGGGNGRAWEDRVVLQVPLYAWALTQLYEGKLVSRTEYRALRTPEDVHVLRLHKIKMRKSAAELVEDEKAAGMMERALDAAADHVAEVRAGRFPARYVESCKCPPFCHAWDICRVKGGPRSAFP